MKTVTKSSCVTFTLIRLCTLLPVTGCRKDARH